MLAPIVLFVYNRPEHTSKAIKALSENELAKDSVLYIYSDGPKNSAGALEDQAIIRTRESIKNLSGFKKVHIKISETNKGLANSIIAGVSDVLDAHDKIIVLEDDIIVSPYFLTYMNDALSLYEKREEVISIHGYNYPIDETGIPETFFMRGADCWGWATWKRGWDLFESDSRKLFQSINSQGLAYEFDRENSFPFSRMLTDQIEGKINSWAIRWYASAFLKNRYTLYPNISLVYNIGFDSSGTHGVGVDDFNNIKWNNTKPVKINASSLIESNRLALERWKLFFSTLNLPNKRKNFFSRFTISTKRSFKKHKTE